MDVNNGGACVLAIRNVHNGAAGVQTERDGTLVVAFKPNLGRIRAAGGVARVDGKDFAIVSVKPSPATAGFVRIELAEIPVVE